MTKPDPIALAVTDLANALAALIAAVQGNPSDGRQHRTVDAGVPRPAARHDSAVQSDAPRALTPDTLLTVPEAAAALRIGRTHLYKLVGEGKLRTVKLGARTLVPYREIQRFIDEALRG